MTGKGFGGHAMGSYYTLIVGVEGGVVIVDDRESRRFTGRRNDSVGALKRASTIPVVDRVLVIRVPERKRTIRVDSRNDLIR